MKIAVKILSNAFLFCSNNKEIVTYIRSEYEQYIVLEDFCGLDFHYIDIDILLKENHSSYDSVIRNIIINTICANGLYYLLHAGIIVVNGTAVLLCGRTMSGKSTACFLMNKLYGFEFVTDDVAFINRSSLSVDGIRFPIKLREKVVNKFGLKKKASLVECNDSGENRYAVHDHNKDILGSQLPLGIIIEIQYVEDILLQSSKLLSGRDAFLTILSNSYSQNRLYDSYDAIIKLARKATVIKVKYHDPGYLYNVIISAMEKRIND